MIRERPREDFAIVPLALLRLPDELLKLWIAARSFDWQKEGEERGGCTASLATLADMTGLCRRRVRCNLGRLAACGAVRVEYRPQQSSRIYCTPETFNPDRLSAAGGAARSPGGRAQPNGTRTARGEAVRSRGDRLSTASEVETLNQKPEVETGCGGPPAAPRARPRSRPVQVQDPQAPLVLTSPQEPAAAKRGRDEAPTAATWTAYAAAYRGRYGVVPVRNARTSGQLAQFVGRVGAEEAPAIATFYVAHNGAYYVTKGHAPGPLLADAEKLRTEWATGQRVNAPAARRNEETEANPFLRISREIAQRKDTDVIDAE